MNIVKVAYYYTPTKRTRVLHGLLTAAAMNTPTWPTAELVLFHSERYWCITLFL